MHGAGRVKQRKGQGDVSVSIPVIGKFQTGEDQKFLFYSQGTSQAFISRRS